MQSATTISVSWQSCRVSTSQKSVAFAGIETGCVHAICHHILAGLCPMGDMEAPKTAFAQSVIDLMNAWRSCRV